MTPPTSRRRWPAVALAFALVGTACSDSSGSATPETTVAPASTTTTLVPDTPTGGPTTAGRATTTTAADRIVVVGLPVTVALPDISVIDPELSMQALSAGDLDRLDARFREDERVDVFLEDVDARGVFRAGELVAVAVAVSVSPGAASTVGFRESFIAGATEGGTVSPAPVIVLDQELTSWLSADTGHLLWAYENLFLIVSGRNPIEVRDITAAIVTMVLAPPQPDIEPEPVPCPEETEGSSTTVAGSDTTSTTATECVPAGDLDEGSTTTSEPAA